MSIITPRNSVIILTKNNSKQRVQPPTQSVTLKGSPSSWLRSYHPIISQCIDYGKFIFYSIWYWSLFDSPVKERSNYHSTTSIDEFVGLFDVLKH